MIGFACEAFIFAYLGLVFFNYLSRAWSFTLIAFELPIICLGRIIGTFGLLTLIRIICCKKFFLNCGELTFVWFAGLIRGAIAFGLVLRLDSEEDISQETRDIIITTALVLVIFTTLVFGSIMPLLSKCLLPKKPLSSRRRSGKSSALNLKNSYASHGSYSKISRPSNLSAFLKGSKAGLFDQSRAHEQSVH